MACGGSCWHESLKDARVLFCRNYETYRWSPGERITGQCRPSSVDKGLHIPVGMVVPIRTVAGLTKNIRFEQSRW